MLIEQLVIPFVFGMIPVLALIDLIPTLLLVGSLAMSRGIDSLCAGGICAGSQLGHAGPRCAGLVCTVGSVGFGCPTAVDPVVGSSLGSTTKTLNFGWLLHIAAVELILTMCSTKPSQEARVSDKRYAVSGWSTRFGKTKIRMAKDLDRIKTLIRTSHEDIHLFTLPTQMTKSEAAVWLTDTQPEFPVFLRPEYRAAAGAAEEAEEAEEAETTEAAAEEPMAASEDDPVEVAIEGASGEESVIVAESMTFEQALEQIPLRENGRFISRERRYAMAHELMSAA
jgi:hypothetical protein